MLLYIPQCIYFYVRIEYEDRNIYNFTFHNVSISTHFLQPHDRMRLPLHSTMYLFLLHLLADTIPLFLLYIPQCIYFYHAALFRTQQTRHFTFHNVSISTRPCAGKHRSNTFFTFHNVSISTTAIVICLAASSSFTFHNVSISTGFFSEYNPCLCTLHSTMYLFLQVFRAHNPNVQI